MAKSRGPEFLRYCIPIIDVLRNLGGSGRPAEVTDLVLERLGVTEAEQEATNQNGGSKVRNQVAWARFYLVKAGYLSSSQRGVWGLTDKGEESHLDHGAVVAMFRELAKLFSKATQKKKEEEQVSEDDTDVDSVDTDEDYRSALLNTLRKLTPDGFERICQRLLRESGFQQVTVTGKSGDGGIDGHGILQINPLVSFKVLFQCKRYQGAVPVSTIRDFRGALQGRADKGIVLTTGIFTTDARREALRDGATPIELVDAEKLVDMFESLSLGLRPKKDFEIDDEFFEQYR
ncbi:MAG: restriction endonuclease [Spartobacteria bacterium]|nr:restriction endonuclease [Spartobacteria bacterium]